MAQTNIALIPPGLDPKVVRQEYETYLKGYLGSALRTRKPEPLPNGDVQLVFEYQGRPHRISMRHLLAVASSPTDRTTGMPADTLRRHAVINAAGLKGCRLEDVDPSVDDMRLEQVVQREELIRDRTPDVKLRPPQPEPLTGENREFASQVEIGVPDTEDLDEDDDEDDQGGT